MSSHVRGVRSLPSTGDEGGRSYEQMVEDIARNGQYFTVPLLRKAVLGGLGVRRKQRAEYVIMVGCACFGTLEAIRANFRLLDDLGIDYARLEKEYCCGAPLIAYNVRRGEDRTSADLSSQQFIEMNIAQAREMGARAIIYFCVWCAYLAKRFFPNCDVEQLYLLDFLATRMTSTPLRLEEPLVEIAYFPGGQHRSWVYAPDRDWEMDWASYRSLLNNIDGLSVIDVPKYCCVINTDVIFQYAQRHSRRTIVTSCIACYGRLLRRCPPGMSVKFISQLLLEALQLEKEG